MKLKTITWKGYPGIFRRTQYNYNLKMKEANLEEM